MPEDVVANVVETFQARLDRHPTLNERKHKRILSKLAERQLNSFAREKPFCSSVEDSFEDAAVLEKKRDFLFLVKRMQDSDAWPRRRLSSYETDSLEAFIHEALARVSTVECRQTRKVRHRIMKH